MTHTYNTILYEKRSDDCVGFYVRQRFNVGYSSVYYDMGDFVKAASCDFVIDVCFIRNSLRFKFYKARDIDGLQHIVAHLFNIPKDIHLSICDDIDNYDFTSHRVITLYDEEMIMLLVLKHGIVKNEFK